MYLLCLQINMQSGSLCNRRDDLVAFICSSLTFVTSASDSVPSDLRVTAWMRSVRLAWRCSNLIFILWKTMSRMLQESALTCRLEEGRCPLTDCGLDWGDVHGLLGRLFRAQYRRGLWTKDDVARAAVKTLLAQVQVTNKVGVTTKYKWKVRPEKITCDQTMQQCLFKYEK